MKASTGIAVVPLLMALAAPASAVVINENFDGGAFNPANFEIGDGSGSAASGAWVSSDRGILRTVRNDLAAGSGAPLVVEADLVMPSFNDIAFLAIRSTGLKGLSNEPSDSVWLRIHNFNNGQVNIADNTSFGASGASFGDAFFDDLVHVRIVDDGTTVTATLTNTVSSVVNTLSLVSAFAPSGHVAFSAGGFSGSTGSTWDNISIGMVAAAAPAPAPGPLGLALMGMTGLLLARRGQVRPAR